MKENLPSLKFYTKEGCRLCDDALLILNKVKRKFPFELISVDINQSNELLEKYRIRIPVIEINNKVEFVYKIEESKLTEILKR